MSFQRINLYDEAFIPSQTVWERTKLFLKKQFENEATLKQNIFDLTFGLFLPILCFFYDPIVFKGVGVRGAVLGNFKPFAYLLCYLALTSLVLWLACGEKLKKLNAILAGIFFASAIVSFIIGIVLLPFSVLGLLVLIGALGFTPLLTAFVFARNGFRAFKKCSTEFDRNPFLATFALTAVLSIGFPAIFNLKLNQAIDVMITYADSRTIYNSTFNVIYIWYLVDTDRIVSAYVSENSKEKKEALETAYQLIDGRDIKFAVRRYND
jgi:hypothetical protein